MFLPQAPSARATPSPLVDMPGRPAILHCAKDRSIPWHTIRIIGCGVVPFLYVYSRSLLVLYGNPFVCQCGAPREWRCMVFRSAEAASGSTALESAWTRWCLLFQVTLVDRMACARFSTHWGLGFNRTLRSSSPAMLQHTIRRFGRVGSRADRAGCGVGRARGAVAGAARDPRRNPNRDRVAGCPATERRFINQALFQPCSARGDGLGGFHTRAQAVVRSYPIALWCLLFQHVTVGQAKYHSHPAAPTVLGSLPLAPTLTAHQD